MRRPHTLHVFQTSEVYSGERPRLVDTLKWLYVGSCPALVVPTKSATVFESHDVTISDPYEVYIDLEFQWAFKQGSAIKWDNFGDLALVVATAPRPYKAGINYTYSMFIAEGETFAGLRVPSTPLLLSESIPETSPSRGVLAVSVPQGTGSDPI